MPVRVQPCRFHALGRADAYRGPSRRSSAPPAVDIQPLLFRLRHAADLVSSSLRIPVARRNRFGHESEDSTTLGRGAAKAETPVVDARDPGSGGPVRHNHPDEDGGCRADNRVLYEPLFAAFARHNIMLKAFALRGQTG